MQQRNPCLRRPLNPSLKEPQLSSNQVVCDALFSADMTKYCVFNHIGINLVAIKKAVVMVKPSIKISIFLL